LPFPIGREITGVQIVFRNISRCTTKPRDRKPRNKGRRVSGNTIARADGLWGVQVKLGDSSGITDGSKEGVLRQGRTVKTLA